MNPPAVALPVAAPARDLRFDSLRGLLLVCMTSNHLPTDLRAVTDQFFGVFSSAEGFVFLSGLLAGYVYTRRRRRDGAAGLRSTAWRRAGTIYNWHIGAYFATLVVLALNAWITGAQSTTSPQLFNENPLLATVLGPLLVYQPGLLDILPMYCLFVLLLPPVLGALERGKIWLVLLPSFSLWLVVQFLPNYDGSLIAPPLNFGFFNLLAWQFLFVAGVIVGHSKISAKSPLAPVRPALLLAAVGVAGFFFCLQHGFIHPLWSAGLFGILLNKPSLGLLRLGDFGLAAYLVAVTGTRFPRLFQWRPLALLGRHSLLVVSTQCVLVLALLAHDELFTTSTDRWLTTIFTIGILFAVAGTVEALQRKAAAPARTFRPLPGQPVFGATQTQD